jgi:hypothetical protein
MLLSADTAAAATAGVCHRADWPSGITDKLLLPGQEGKRLMEKASFNSVS